MIWSFLPHCPLKSGRLQLSLFRKAITTPNAPTFFFWAPRTPKRLLFLGTTISMSGWEWAYRAYSVLNFSLLLRLQYEPSLAITIAGTMPPGTMPPGTMQVHVPRWTIWMNHVCLNGPITFFVLYNYFWIIDQAGDFLTPTGLEYRPVGMAYGYSYKLHLRLCCVCDVFTSRAWTYDTCLGMCTCTWWHAHSMTWLSWRS